jgi:hypothetical protein
MTGVPSHQSTTEVPVWSALACILCGLGRETRIRTEAVEISYTKPHGPEVRCAASVRAEFVDHSKA